MPTPGNSAEEKSSTSISLGEGAGSSESAPELNAPVHEERPQIIDPSANDSSFTTPKEVMKGIHVVATRKAFYNQRRVRKGEKLVIASEEKFGTWHKCLDPEMEKLRLAKFNKKKAKK